MRLWFVVYILGNAALVVGPLPYDKPACTMQKLVAQADVDAAFKAHGGVLPPMGGVTKKVRPQDVRLECVEAAERPALKN